MTTLQVLKKEADFHDKRFGAIEDSRDKLGKFYSVNKAATDSYYEKIKSATAGKKLLEYGCGSGSNIKRWAGYGAIQYGIDISSEGIKESKKIAKSYRISKNFSVMNAEATTFDDSSFDIVVGTGILHHLDLNNSYKELARLTAKDGIAIFIEPLGHNPFINLFRKLTPTMRTEDEHPLMVDDIKLADKYFGEVITNYYILTSLLAVPFRNKAFFSTVLRYLTALDYVIFKLPFLRRFAWMVVLELKQPKK